MKILPNNVAVIDGDSHHAVWVAKDGLEHDKWMAGIIRDVIRNHGVKFAIDGGANIGTLTKTMLDAGALVVAFEANEEAVECLLHNCGKSARLKVVHAALGDKAGYVMLRKQANAGATYAEEVEVNGVDMVAVDHYRLVAVDFVKLDIEGFEIKALQGARATIRRCHPILLLEVNSGALERAGGSREELIRLVEHLGYRWKILQPDAAPEDPQYDIICHPRGK